MRSDRPDRRGRHGIGEVYKAESPREGQVLASLNHPTIAHIHELEEADGIRALVTELAGGPTLADRIAQGNSTR